VFGNLTCTPRLVSYVPAIEEAISILESKISQKACTLPARWICLKLLDGNEKILLSIDKNLPYSLFSKKIQSSVAKALEVLEKNSINQNNFKDFVVSNIMFDAEEVCKKTVYYSSYEYSKRDRKIDKILTSKKYGIPIMLLFLGFIFWLTIVASNVPSKILSNFFDFFENKLEFALEWLNSPKWLINILVSGIYKTVTWVISVMLPPMAIFFPLFTILEDFGYLPRIAFNLDGLFKKACTNRQTSINHVHGIWL
jgi:ferrous iron transport protein B